jgi:hypothetical protein
MNDIEEFEYDCDYSYLEGTRDYCDDNEEEELDIIERANDMNSNRSWGY